MGSFVSTCGRSMSFIGDSARTTTRVVKSRSVVTGRITRGTVPSYDVIFVRNSRVGAVLSKCLTALSSRGPRVVKKRLPSSTFCCGQ